MVGRTLKGERAFVYVMMPDSATKHMFGGETPERGDFTVCGERILLDFRWAQSAKALKGEYCRECERIWGAS